MNVEAMLFAQSVKVMEEERDRRRRQEADANAYITFEPRANGYAAGRYAVRHGAGVSYFAHRIDANRQAAKLAAQKGGRVISLVKK